LVASLGAHEVIDYTVPNAFDNKGPFDIVLDCVGGSPSRWTPLLAPGGRFASCMPGPGVFARAALNSFTSRRVRPVLLKPNAADLRVLDALYEQEKLRVKVDSRYPLLQLDAAWQRSKSGRAVGKIVVEIDPA
jgi:alcohol dehydrogenase